MNEYVKDECMNKCIKWKNEWICKDEWINKCKRMNRWIKI